MFDLVNFVPVDGDSAPGAGDGKGFPGGIKQDRANDIIATRTSRRSRWKCRQLPDRQRQRRDRRWTSASLRQARVLNPRATFGRPDVERRRLDAGVAPVGMPLVNELVIGMPDKDRFNASEPKDDGQFATM